MGLSEDFKDICQDLVNEYDNDPANLLQVLLKVQRRVPGNYISYDISKYIAHLYEVPLSTVSEVVTYFDALNEKASGTYKIQICNATACFIGGYKTIAAEFEKQLGIKMGETTKDNKITLDYTPCFGACDIAPAVRIGNKVYGNLDEQKIANLISVLKEGKA